MTTCRHYGSEIADKAKTIKIPELNIEVTKPIKWTKTVGELLESDLYKNHKKDGWEIIEKWQLWFILDGSKYMNKFLGNFKGKWNLFYCAPSNYTKLNKLPSLSRLDLDWNDGYDLAVSDGDGRVVLCRGLKQDGKL